MVCVPTSYTCTMWGGCLDRYAATAALRVSAYVPLCTAFTTYSLCEALNLAAMSLTRSPSTAVIACQNWISVAAIPVAGEAARSTAETSTLRVERFMRASIFFTRLVRESTVSGAPHYSTRNATLRRRPDGCFAALRAELVRASDVGVIGLELGVEPTGRPAAELRHALPDRLRAVLSLTSAGADSGAAQQHVLQRDGQLVLHRVVQLGDDIWVRGAQPLGPARHLAGERQHARPAAAVRRHERLERVPREPRGRHLARDVEPGARLGPRRCLVVGAVEGDALAAALAAAPEASHDLIAER